MVVVTRLPGAAPEEMETDVTEKIEEAVNTISGIDEMTSITSEGVSQVLITFVLEKDVDVAVQEVRDRIGQIIPDLPRDAETPVVQKFDPDAVPVVILARPRRSGPCGRSPSTRTACCAGGWRRCRAWAR